MIAEHDDHALLPNQSPFFPMLGEVRPTFKKALNFDLRGEAARSKSLQRFSHNRSGRLVRDQYFAAAISLLVAIAHGCGGGAITLLQTRLCFLSCLAGILLALQLGLCGKDGFREFALRGILRFEVQELHPDTPGSKHVAQIQMVARLSGKALVIIKDYHIRFSAAFVGIDMRNKFSNGRTLGQCQSARLAFKKDCFNRIAVQLGMAAAAIFLAIKP